MPLKGPEAEVLGREDDFHGSGVNRIDSTFDANCLILCTTTLTGWCV
jgi:hypothetical protein